MNRLTFRKEINGINYELTRVEKRKAKQLFNEGKGIVILGNNENPLSVWTSLCITSKVSCEVDFDSLYNAKMFYLPKELGDSLNFYVAEERR